MGRERHGKPSIVRFCIAGVLVVPIVAIGASNPPSVSGASYLLGLLLIWLGPYLAQRASGARRRLIAYSGVLLMAATALGRIAGGSGDRFHFDHVGGSTGVHTVLSRLIDERDLSVGASRIFSWSGVLPVRGDALPGAFHETYDAMARAHDTLPSPQLPTLLAGQHADGFDLLRYDAPNPKGTVVFLHGYGGGVSALCWQIAQAAAAASFDTACPNTRTQGDWGSEEGQAIVSATLDRVQAPVVLVGLSAGARGAALLAPRLSTRLAGLVLISGASRRGRRAGVPTLVIYGRDDGMFAPQVIRDYVTQTSARAVSMPGGHFIFLTKRERIAELLRPFLEARL